MNKFISYILAGLILVLSCFPCDDVVINSINDGQASTIQAASNHNDCGSHAGDLCSPFCTCSCCSGITVPVTPVVAFTAGREHIERLFASYLPEDVVGIALPIWQPPRLL